MSDELKEVLDEVQKQKMEMIGFQYRLQAVEDNWVECRKIFGALDAKIDSVLERLSSHSEANALTAQRINMITQDQQNLLNRIDSMEKQMTDVKVNVAKKVAYGAAGGALIAGLAELAKLLGS